MTKKPSTKNTIITTTTSNANIHFDFFGGALGDGDFTSINPGTCIFPYIDDMNVTIVITARTPIAMLMAYITTGVLSWTNTACPCSCVISQYLFKFVK